MANGIEKLHGIIVPLCTPFTPEGRVDEAGLRNLARFVVNGGVDGLFVMGTTGEFMHLPDQEQWPAIEAVMDEVGDRTLVVAGITGDSVETTIRNIVKVSNLPRPPRALVVAPLCYHSNRKLPHHMERLCSITDLPVILYNNIGIVNRRWKRKDIIPELVTRIARLENVVAIKDSSGNLEYLNRILLDKPKDFLVFQGEEGMIFQGLEHGAVGGVPSIGNILPELCVRLYRSHLDGDKPKARTCQQAIVDLHNLYLKYGCIPAVLKAYLVRKGIIESSFAYHPFPGDIAPLMDQVLDKISRIEVQE